MAKLRVKNCTGCGACANICPHSAIKMIEDKKGFLKPEIDKNKCTNCGLCEKNCPVLHYVSDNTLSPKVYAFINNDEQINCKKLLKQCRTAEKNKLYFIESTVQKEIKELKENGEV